jgi:serine palmitoyltransferase
MITTIEGMKNDPMAEEKPENEHNNEPEAGAAVIFLTLCNYLLMTVIGHFRDFCATLTGKSRYKNQSLRRKGFASLFKSQESFYTRRLYHRLQDCWNRPLSSGPGCHVDVMERVSVDGNCSFQKTGRSKRCVNLGSYNYLGFADDWKETCRDDVVDAVEKYPNSMSSSRADFGTVKVHQELEEYVAKFIGKEAAAVFPMGFSTNGTTIPALMGPGSLIISDALNHTSIVNGARSSPSQIRVFKHNQPEHLDEILREAIVKGQPKHHRPWTKILVMVEGIYSMEGNICRLAEIVAVCKKYKAFIYVDEAHSIGALGRTGRGICEHCGVDPADVDILMGTFTKSFSGMGGYIASSQEVVDFVRSHSAGVLNHNSMSPVVCQQVLTAFKVISGDDGTNVGQRKLTSLIANSNYFRRRMIEIGMHVYGNYDSPIIPVLIYFPSKVAAFSRECLARGVAVVVVGFPATSIIYSRARFCISAGLEREDIDKAIAVIDEVATLLCMKYGNNFLGFDMQSTPKQIEN